MAHLNRCLSRISDCDADVGIWEVVFSNKDYGYLEARNIEEATKLLGT